MEDIIIKKSEEDGCFDVHVGNRSTGPLSFDEMLGTVAQLTVPDSKRCLSWLMTKEQHEAFRKRFKQPLEQHNPPLSLPLNAVGKENTINQINEGWKE